MSKELFLFGRFFLLGAGLLLCYDCIRGLRRIAPHGILWISLEDFLFAALSGGWFFLRLCEWNDGILRAYILLAVLFGAVVAYFFFEKILFFIKKQLKKVFKAVTMGRDNVWRERHHGRKKKKAP